MWTYYRWGSFCRTHHFRFPRYSEGFTKRDSQHCRSSNPDRWFDCSAYKLLVFSNEIPRKSEFKTKEMSVCVCVLRQMDTKNKTAPQLIASMSCQSPAWNWCRILVTAPASGIFVELKNKTTSERGITIIPVRGKEMGLDGTVDCVSIRFLTPCSPSLFDWNPRGKNGLTKTYHNKPWSAREGTLAFDRWSLLILRSFGTDQFQAWDREKRKGAKKHTTDVTRLTSPRRVSRARSFSLVRAKPEPEQMHHKECRAIFLMVFYDLCKNVAFCHRETPRWVASGRAPWLPFSFHSVRFGRTGRAGIVWPNQPSQWEERIFLAFAGAHRARACDKGSSTAVVWGVFAFFCCYRILATKGGLL